jgi:hypothetical protein
LFVIIFNKSNDIMFIFLIVLIWFFGMWVAIHFIKKHHDKFTSEVTEIPEPKVVQEEVIPTPVKKKRVYKKRVKKNNKE